MKIYISSQSVLQVSAGLYIYCKGFLFISINPRNLNLGSYFSNPLWRQHPYTRTAKSIISCLRCLLLIYIRLILISASGIHLNLHYRRLGTLPTYGKAVTTTLSFGTDITLTVASFIVCFRTRPEDLNFELPLTTVYNIY
jgi:hypothetical protein